MDAYLLVWAALFIRRGGGAQPVLSQSVPSPDATKYRGHVDRNQFRYFGGIALMKKCGRFGAIGTIVKPYALQTARLQLSAPPAQFVALGELAR